MGKERINGQTDYFHQVGDINVTETVVDRSIARIFQRDKQNGLRTQQSLGAYDTYGKVSNPSEGTFPAKLRQEAIQLIEVKTPRLSTEEKEYMGLLLPSLVEALVLDEDHIDKIYNKDISSVPKIALDWFLRPEEIEQTHIRVGFGGEEVVNSRAPAYIVPALTTLERVKTAFGRYTNWAIHHELCTTVGDSEEVNNWIGQKIRETVGPKTHEDGREFTQDDYLEEIQLARHLPIDGTRGILQDAWKESTGENPDMDALAQKYHFTDKLPKIVVFNASHAAIEIDRMDKEKTLAARDETQRLLKTYAEKFHPDVAQNLVFENDLPWDQHDYYTKMLTLYVSNIIDNENGEKKAVEEKLYQFGQHHQRDQDGPLMGMERSDLYGKLHVFFFEDPFTATSWAEKIPTPNVMERPHGSPRNVIFHQGNPEIKFGLYRKIASEKANLSGFVKWLNQRQSLAFDGSNLAQEVLVQAQELHTISNGKRDFKSCLGEVINETTRKNTSVKSIFFEFIGSGVFQDAEDKEEAWEKFAARLEHDVAFINREESQMLIEKLMERQETMRSLTIAVNLAKQKDDDETLVKLYNTPEGQEVSSERNRLECVTPQGTIPVYYPLANADSIVWPQQETPSLERYVSKLENARKKQKRLEGTIGFTETKIISPIINHEQDGWTLLASGLNDYVKTSLNSNGAQTHEWLRRDSKTLQNLYLQVDGMEKDGYKDEEIIDKLQNSVREIVEARAGELAQSAHVELSAAINFASQQLMPDVVKKARKQTLQEAAAEVSKATAVLKDHRSILADIDPDEEVAERKYNELLQSFFISANGIGKEEEIGQEVIFEKPPSHQLPHLPQTKY